MGDIDRIDTSAQPIAFGAADSADFFGRAALIERLLERLAEESVVRSPLSVAEDVPRRATDNGQLTTNQSRFLAVVGPSGSGKSSVVRAGLIPALRRGGLPESQRWFVVEITPGAYPLEELEAGLLRVAVNPPPSLLEQLRSDERGLLRAIKRVLPAGDTAELVLVIDQFEELFTLVESEATRAHFLDSLVAAVADPRSRARVIITLRADFYDRPLMYAGMGALIRERTEVVLPLTPEELEQAINGPAERVGITFEPGLVTAIVKDVSDQPGTLPLLQYALTELFERRQGRVLTLGAYQASGSVLGALARRADELYDRLDAQGQEATRQLLLRLVALGEGVEDTRRRVRLSELSTADHRPPTTDGGDVEQLSVVGHRSSVVELYVRYRLLTFDRDPITREPTVEVAHEALIRNWGRLRQWLDASRDDLRVQRRLAAAAHEWQQSGRDGSFLADGVRLAQFQDLATNADLVLNQEELDYLGASAGQRDREAVAERERQQRELMLQRRAANRLRYLVSSLALFLAVAIGLSVFAFYSRADAVAQRQQADANFNRSEAQRLAAEANTLLQAHGNSEVTALLSIRSIRTQYTPQGDAALAGAAMLDYPSQRFIGHGGPIWSVAYSPNGDYVMTGSEDQTARLWDARSGKQLRVLSGHTAAIHSVTISPDGNYLCTGSSDQTARIWDARTGKLLHILGGQIGAINGVVFSPDNRCVLTGGEDHIARLWDAQTGVEVRQFVGQANEVNAVAFSPDNKYALRDVRLNNHPIGEVWRGLRPLQTSPMVGVRGRLRRPRTPTIGMF